MSPWRSRRRRPFPPRQRRLLGADRRTARSSDEGHGRRERRELVSTTILSGYAGWPGLAQVFRLTRERVIKGKATLEVAYGITSLGRERADAARRLGLVRRHWGIENRLHYVRDVTLGEDACRVRSGSAPQLLACLRNAAMHLLRGIDAGGNAAATRHLNAKPRKAIKLIQSKPEN